MIVFANRDNDACKCSPRRHVNRRKPAVVYLERGNKSHWGGQNREGDHVTDDQRILSKPLTASAFLQNET